MDIGRSGRRALTWTTLCVTAAACDGAAPEPLAGTEAATPIPERAPPFPKIDPAISGALERGEARKVLVLLKDEAVRKWMRAFGADAERATDSALEWRANAYDELKDRVWARLRTGGATRLGTFRHLPVVHARIADPETLERLADAPEVERIVPDTRYQMVATPSLTLINQPQAEQAGKIGADTSVAVLDTGVDYTRAAFGCTSPGVPAGCKVAYARDFATEDGALDAHGHGTNVAGIVAGVAPGTKILALDVFDGDSAWSSVILQAIDWSIQNRAQYKIAALNMSLGSGRWDAACGSDTFAGSVASARTAGILPAVASGNNGYTNALASPACVPAAVSVGAVYYGNVGGLNAGVCSDATSAADKVVCFSNSASFLTMLAPGVYITAAGITMSGTSQAAPHVAGAAAVLRAAFPTATVDTLVKKMTSTGTKVTDARNSIVKPRLDLYAATNSTAEAAAVPVGTMTLNGGASATKSATVTAAFSMTTATATEVCLSNSYYCSAWTSFASTKTWTLDAGDGYKWVSVWFRNADGAVSASADTRGIMLDTTLPTDGTVSLSKPSSTSLALAWSGFADGGSGIDGYRVMMSQSAAPTSCTSGTPVYSGANTSYTMTISATGSYHFRVCAVDKAGNVSTGTTKQALAVPAGTVSLNGGVANTASTSVTATLTVTTGAASQVCLSNTASCSSWVTYARTVAWTLTAGDGAKTVYVWFKNADGQASTQAATDSITLDTTAPTNGTATIAKASATTLRLAWSGFADSGSGIGAYKVMVSEQSLPAASCAAGTLVYNGAGTAYVKAATVNKTYYFRVCAADKVGNVSTGTTAQLKFQ